MLEDWPAAALLQPVKGSEKESIDQQGICWQKELCPPAAAPPASQGRGLAAAALPVSWAVPPTSFSSLEDADDSLVIQNSTSTA